jgi:hypothetical protein
MTSEELRGYLDNINELLCDEMDVNFQAFVMTRLVGQPEQIRDDDKIIWDMIINRRR